MSSPTDAPNPGAPAPPPDGGRGGKMFDRLKRAATGAPPPPEVVQVHYDPLTGLPAREHLTEWVDQAIRRSSPTSSRVVLAFVSVGLLRDINDSYGADVGDQLLRAVAERLQSIDLPGTKVLRYEGAEFAVIFEKLNQANVNEEIANFLVELLLRPFEIAGEHMTISPTVGSAISADNYHSIDDFISDAHRSLAQARDAGVRFELHDETKRGRYETRVDEARLQDAIRNEEFVLHYQPIVRCETAELVGFEALLRWKAPGATNAGVLFPGDFLPLLEKTGMSVAVGRWALREACQQMGDWTRLVERATPLFVTCNVSPRHLADDEFADDVRNAVRAGGIAPSQLCLDLTEQALRFTGTEAWPSLRELSNDGVKLSLDDFGTGITSLHWLLELSLDHLHVERSFVSQLGTDDASRSSLLPDPVGVILAHLSVMATDLGIEVVAEGVEDQAQALAVAALGIPLAQGYHFGRPMSALAATAMVDPSADTSTVWDPEDVYDRGD